MVLQQTDQGMADYVLELSEAEAEALKDTVRSADGRRSEVKTARDALGL